MKILVVNIFISNTRYWYIDNSNWFKTKEYYVLHTSLTLFCISCCQLVQFLQVLPPIVMSLLFTYYAVYEALEHIENLQLL